MSTLHPASRALDEGVINDTQQHRVVLDSIASVNNYRIQPSVTSSTPVSVLLCNHAVNETSLRYIAELVWISKGVTILDLGWYGCLDVAVFSVVGAAY